MLLCLQIWTRTECFLKLTCLQILQITVENNLRRAGYDQSVQYTGSGKNHKSSWEVKEALRIVNVSKSTQEVLCKDWKTDHAI